MYKDYDNAMDWENDEEFDGLDDFGDSVSDFEEFEQTEIEDDSVEVNELDDDFKDINSYEECSVGVETANDEDFGEMCDTEDLLDESIEHERLITGNNRGNDFIGDKSTSIIVASGQEDSETFKIVYASIDSIAVTRRIRINPNVDELMNSIKETGLLEPITVALTQTQGVYVLLDGFRRLLACARLGKSKIPCIVNRNINVPDIPIIAAMYNKNKMYTIKEMVDYIDYLEKEKGVMNPQLIEYLLPLNPGDYNKLKDIIADNDDDIIDKLFKGTYTIEQAFKKVEKKRKEMNEDQKEAKKAEQAAENGTDLEKINDQGEDIIDDEAGSLTDEQLSALNASASSLEEGLDDQTVEEMDEEANNIDDSFKPHQQKVGEREYIDPNLKKSVLVRDNYKCWCCKTGGEAFVDVLDFHHIVPVFLGGKDSKDNAVMLCLTCHRMVHLYQTRDLYLPEAKKQDEIDQMTEAEKAVYEAERNRYKRIIKLGTVIREGMHQKGINLKQYKKDHPIGNIGRNKPGKEQEKT